MLELKRNSWLLAILLIMSVYPEPITAQTDDIDRILHLFETPADAENALTVLIRESLKARSLTPEEEHQVLDAVLDLLRSNEKESRFVGLHLSYEFGRFRPALTPRLIPILQSTNDTVLSLSFIEGSHWFSNDEVIIPFLADAASAAGPGLRAELAVHELSIRGDAGRARLRELDAAGAITDPDARRLLEKLRAEGRLGG